MNFLIVIVILSLGYSYIQSEPFALFKYNRSTGWQTYCQIGFYGLSMLVIGCIVTSFLWLTIKLLEFLLYFIFTFSVQLNGCLSAFLFNNQVFNIDSTLVIVIIISFLSLSLIKKQNLKDRLKKNKIDIYLNKLANECSTEKILLESMSKGLLVSITLKSRKVYIGMVDSGRFIGKLDKSSIVLLPFLSGFRDKENLDFHVTTNYVNHYIKNDITLNSFPLTIYQYRYVILIEEVEHISLFSTEAYIKF